MTAEFLAEAGDLARLASADQLASAAGLAPVLQQSGKMHYLRRATAGSKTMKFVFYQSALAAIRSDPASKAFYARKRAEGKRPSSSPHRAGQTPRQRLARTAAYPPALPGRLPRNRYCRLTKTLGSFWTNLGTSVVRREGSLAGPG
ncbi:transposase [Nocardia mangyaensis]|uniref:transposase n=1 Tax=Nocardia mangyaensis TaxID=2213200 RepID=UPI003B82D4C3